MRSTYRIGLLTFAAMYAGKAAGAHHMEKEEAPNPSITEQALANIKTSHEVVTLAGQAFEVKRLVTRPALKIEDDNPIYIQFVQPINEPDRDENGVVVVRNNMAAPWTAIVVDLKDGVEKDIVLNAVFLNSIRKSYPDSQYVHKAFAVRKLKSASGKRYSNFDIAEIVPKTIEH